MKNRNILIGFVLIILAILIGIFIIGEHENMKNNSDKVTILEEVDWQQRAEQAQKDLMQLYWNDELKIVNTLYPAPSNIEDIRFHYWWQAHVLDALMDGYDRTKDNWYLDRFDLVYESVLKRNGYIITNEFYDDMEWMALALLRAYQATASEKYKKSVLFLWDTIKLGWNDSCGGGISWKTDQTEYKNTPANMPAAILVARLYKEFGSEEDLAWSKKLFDWQLNNLVDPESGIVWDGMNRTGNGMIDKSWLFTYCQGVFIGAAVELYHITGEEQYIELANKTAEASLDKLINHETGTLVNENDGDGGLFKGIFIRYFSNLIQVEKNQEYIHMIYENGNSLWTNGRDTETGLLSRDWYSKPEFMEDLSVQLSGIMLIEQLAKLQDMDIENE